MSKYSFSSLGRNFDAFRRTTSFGSKTEFAQIWSNGNPVNLAGQDPSIAAGQVPLFTVIPLQVPSRLRLFNVWVANSDTVDQLITTRAALYVLQKPNASVSSVNTVTWRLFQETINRPSFTMSGSQNFFSGVTLDFGKDLTLYPNSIYSLLVWSDNTYAVFGATESIYSTATIANMVPMTGQFGAAPASFSDSAPSTFTYQAGTIPYYTMAIQAFSDKLFRSLPVGYAVK